MRLDRASEVDQSCYLVLVPLTQELAFPLLDFFLGLCLLLFARSRGARVQFRGNMEIKKKKKKLQSSLAECNLHCVGMAISSIRIQFFRSILLSPGSRSGKFGTTLNFCEWSSEWLLILCGLKTWGSAWLVSSITTVSVNGWNLDGGDVGVQRSAGGRLKYT